MLKPLNLGTGRRTVVGCNLCCCFFRESKDNEFQGKKNEVWNQIHEFNRFLKIDIIKPSYIF